MNQRLIIFFFLFSLQSSFSFSQNAQRDSLEYAFDTISSLESKMKFCVNQAYSQTELKDDFNFWSEKGINLAIENDSLQWLPWIYARMTYLAISCGALSEAADFLYEGRKHLNKTTNYVHWNLFKSAEGNYYTVIEQFDKSAESYLEIIEDSRVLQDSSYLSGAYHNLGICYYKKGNYELADSMILEAYKINTAIGFDYFLTANLSMLANIQEQLGNTEKALEYNLKCRDEYDRTKDLNGMTFIRINLASVYWTLNQKSKAYESGKEGLKLARENNFKEWEYNALQGLSDFYYDDKEYKKAYDYYVEYSTLKSDLINSETATKLDGLSLELKNENLKISRQNEEIQKQQLALQDEQIISQNAEGAKQRVITYFLIGGLIILGLFGFIIYNRFKLIQKQNVIIEKQKVKVELAFEEIAEKNRNIQASLTYAERIQRAILPTEEVLNASLNSHFVLFKPKDVVSGDFYWTESTDEFTFIAAADCTGHGVPGALVSVICHNALNRTVKEFGLTDPGEILDKTRDIVTEQFEKSNEDVKDGMDIALCVINNKTKQVKFSGANNPIWLVRDNQLNIIKGDRQPIGRYEMNQPFETHIIETQKDDLIYLFSDGLVDQFGGEKGKKMKPKGLASLLLSSDDFSLKAQHTKLESGFDKWRGEYEQTDDVCLIGIKL